MIIPILNGLRSFREAPVTWLLFLLNALVFFVSLAPALVAQNTIKRHLDDDQFLQLQGRMFAQYVQQSPQQFSPLVREVAKLAESGDPEKFEILGSLASRDENFMSEADTLVLSGDRVEIRQWRRRVLELRGAQDRHPSHQLGLTAADLGLGKWLSYIFVHSGPHHFIGNMYFLLIFGSVLEPVIGSLALLSTFLLTGVVAAGMFLLLSGASAAPLIGASGAISGLMVLYCAYHWRRPARFLYVLLPSARYVGFVYLPAWIVLIMFATSDLAGYLGAVTEFGGVAYTAHLGGELAAAAIALIVFMVRRKALLNLPVENAPMGEPVSLVDMVEQGAFRSRPSHVQRL